MARRLVPLDVLRETLAEPGAVPARPIPTTATLLAGGLCANEVTPTVAPIGLRYKLTGLSSGTEKHDHWYPPRAMQ